MAGLTLVLVGPMTGLPDYNYPAFHAAAAALRAAGYQVINPAENPEQESWEAYLRYSLTELLKGDAVATLDGHWASRGARLELHVSRKLEMPEFSVQAWLAKAEFAARAA